MKVTMAIPPACLVTTSHVQSLSVQTFTQQVVVYGVRGGTAGCAGRISAQALGSWRDSLRDGFPHGGSRLLLGGCLSIMSVEGLPQLCHQLVQVLVARCWICTERALL